VGTQIIALRNGRKVLPISQGRLSLVLTSQLAESVRTVSAKPEFQTRIFNMGAERRPIVAGRL